MTTNPQTDRRDRYAETMARTDGWEWAAANFSSLSTPTADRYRRAAEAVMAIADAEQAELRRERDLAIAHDRQPYPTAWAYEQACKALRRKEAAIERVLEFAASLDDVGRQLAGPDAVHPVAAHIRHLLDKDPEGGARRAADEEQPAERPYPDSNTWTFEVCYDADNGKWHGCGGTYDSSVFENAHDMAQADFQHRAGHDKQQRKFRMIRATTTYTVEAEHAPEPQP